MRAYVRDLEALLDTTGGACSGSVVSGSGSVAAQAPSVPDAAEDADVVVTSGSGGESSDADAVNATAAIAAHVVDVDNDDDSNHAGDGAYGNKTDFVDGASSASPMKSPRASRSSTLIATHTSTAKPEVTRR